MDYDRRHALDIRIEWDFRNKWTKLSPRERAELAIQWVKDNNVFIIGVIPSVEDLWWTVLKMLGTGLASPSAYLSAAFLLNVNSIEDGVVKCS